MSLFLHSEAVPINEVSVPGIRVLKPAFYPLPGITLASETKKVRSALWQPRKIERRHVVGRTTTMFLSPNSPFGDYLTFGFEAHQLGSQLGSRLVITHLMRMRRLRFRNCRPTFCNAWQASSFLSLPSHKASSRQLRNLELPAASCGVSCEILRSRYPPSPRLRRVLRAFIPVASYGVFGEGE